MGQLGNGHNKNKVIEELKPGDTMLFFFRHTLSNTQKHFISIGIYFWSLSSKYAVIMGWINEKN